MTVTVEVQSADPNIKDEINLVRCCIVQLHSMLSPLISASTMDHYKQKKGISDGLIALWLGFKWTTQPIQSGLKKVRNATVRLLFDRTCMLGVRRIERVGLV
ncbi:hypothetical protein AKJ16_DCAP19206 [Drosera capensis]